MSDEEISKILTEAESLSDIEIEEAEKLKRKLEKRHARNSRQSSRDREVTTSVERTKSDKPLNQGIDPTLIRERPDKINRRKLSAQRKKLREQQTVGIVQHVEEHLTKPAISRTVGASARRRGSKSLLGRKSEDSGHEQILLNWQTLKQQAEITEEEEVNFFVRQIWPTDFEEVKPSDKEDITYVREQAEPSVTGSFSVASIIQQPRASGDFARRSGVFLDSQPHDLVWGRDRWPLSFERIDAESHLLYSPSNLEVPLEVKTQGRSVRYAEDEGLYVGQLPFVTPANIRRLENRLLREAEYPSGVQETQKQLDTHDDITQWFTEDGRLKMATSPLRDVLFRPFQSMNFLSDVHQEFNYVFLPPLSDQEMRSLEQSYSRVNNPIQRTFQLPFRRSNGVGTTPLDFQQIEIELASVSFSFHPLFLAEHVFAHNLRMLVKALEDMVGRDHINACIQRIAALKRAIKQLEEKAAQKANQEHVEDECGFSAQIREYQSEIDTLRRARNRAEGFERGLLTSILRCWKRIKDTREEQGFISTTVGLKIIKENIDTAADEFAWKKEIAELTEEARKKHELRRKRLMTEYEAALAGYQATLREEAAGGKEKRDSVKKPEPPAEFDAVSARKTIVSELETYRRRPGESKISVLLNESVDITPEFECPRSEQKRRKAMNSFTYFAKLHYNGKFIETTPNLCLDDKFTLRFGQVYPLQVCDPPDDISATIYEKHGCVIKRIAEVHLAKATLLSLNRCPSSSASHPSVSLSFCVLNPSPVSAGLCAGLSPHRVLAGLEFVLESLEGSGEALVRLVPNGSVTLGVKWRLPEAYGNLMGDTTCGMERGDRRDRASGLGSEAQTDPNDPIYIKMLKSAQGPMNADERRDLGDDFNAQTRAIGLSYFRLDPHLQQFRFCSDEELDLSKRFRLLQLRSSGHRDFQELVVPLNSREVPVGIFEKLEPVKEKIMKLKTKGLEQHFAERNRYLREIGNEVLKRFEASIKKKTLSDVVAEEEIPSLTALWPLLTEFMRRRRPLNPNRKEMKKTSIQTIKETGVVLVVTIGDAKNLPVRVIEQTSRTTGRPTELPLRPVIEVRFEDFVQTTPVGEGCNPSWNSEFRIPYKPPSHLISLDSVGSSILINVFDEVTNVVEDGRRPQQAFGSGEDSTNATDSVAAASKTVLHRSERRWLGGLQVPFSVVYSSGKITGNIELKLPPAMLSYTRPKPPYDDTSTTEAPNEQTAYISVYLALQPAVKPFQTLSDQISSMESAELVAKVKSWEQEVAKRSKNQENNFDFEALVMDSSCRSVLACRFLVPQNPPSDFLPSTYTAGKVEEVKLRLARYVSLIPFFSDSIAFHGLTDVWCSSEQFLKMLCGDNEEHAILLANYFLFLEARLTEATQEVEGEMEGSENEAIPNVLLCVGKAVPDGNTMFVMARNYTSTAKSRPIAQWLFWNPLTGRFYAITDVNSPLRTVSCLISPNKIWANVQEKAEPWEVSWDLGNHKCWLPFDAVVGDTSLGAQTPIHAGRHHQQRTSSIFSVQPRNLGYSIPNEREILALKFELEGALKDSFIEWRRGEITRMNYEFMREMTKILEQLEDNFGQQNEAVEESLSRITQKYEAYGFPLNMYNMTKEEILERVKVTGLHQLQGIGRPSYADGLFTSSTSLVGPGRMQSSNVQFSIAVYIRPYPGNVLSIWIYLAALWPRAGGLLSLL